jgi:hypothetical protein
MLQKCSRFAKEEPWLRAKMDDRLKPQSHRIVRFLDRAIGGDLAQVRPIATSAAISICNRILRLLFGRVVGHRATGGTRGRAITNNRRTSRETSGSDQRPIVRSIVATCDRSHRS